MPSERKPPAPPDLAASGRRLWRRVAGDYELRPDEWALLVELCRQVDELQVIRAALAESGAMVTGSKGQPRPNPLLAEARAARMVLVRVAAQLGLPELDGERKQTVAQRHARKAARARWADDGAA